MTRITLLKMVSIAAGAVCFASAMINPAQARTIGFDDLSTSNSLISNIPNGYRGFNWNLFYGNASSTALQGTGLEMAMVSPNIDLDDWAAAERFCRSAWQGLICSIAFTASILNRLRKHAREKRKTPLAIALNPAR